jgi:hypothetical protein
MKKKSLTILAFTAIFGMHLFSQDLKDVTVGNLITRSGSVLKISLHN